jgi:hypothetical protein
MSYLRKHNQQNYLKLEGQRKCRAGTGLSIGPQTWRARSRARVGWVHCVDVASYRQEVLRQLARPTPDINDDCPGVTGGGKQLLKGEDLTP